MAMFLWKKTQSFLRYFKIALCVFVVYLLVLVIFSSVFQSNKHGLYTKKAPISSTDQIRAFITDERIASKPSGKVIIPIYKALMCSLTGEACYADLSKKNPSSLSSFIASTFAFPFLNPPASGVGVTVQTLAQAGFIPKSYAAEGVGFASIRPLMNVWKAMRDVAYLLLVLVIVTIGFMIMLRTKINPQTIVNVENSLPKIVMALIYITFSFAIAGFLIDLMYVSMVLIIAILGPEQSARTTKDLTTTLLQAGPGTILQILFNFNFMTIFWTLPNALLGILGDMIGIILRLILTAVVGFFLNPFIDRALAWMWQPDMQASAIVLQLNGVIRALLRAASTPTGVVITFAVAALLIPFVIGAIIFFTVLMLFFRIFLLIFSNYIKLFVLIIISPIYLLMEAIPGQSTFSGWIKSIIELLVPYPVIIATFLIGSIIMEKSITGVLWTPPFLVGLTSEYLSVIIGVWVLFMIPEFVGMAQKMVNPKPMPLDAGVGTFFGGAKTGVETGLGEMSKYALLSQQFSPLGRIFDMIPGFKKKG